MKTRPFGSTGRLVPVIGQGTWQLKDAARAEEALRRGLDRGLVHVDTAELYQGSETVVGRAIAGRRKDVFLVSKVLPKNASYEGTLAACEGSLERLHASELDVYLLHWWSDQYPVADTMRAMGELLDAGKTRWVGVSNLEVHELEQAQAALGKNHRIVCNQVYYDLEHRHMEDLLLSHCRKNQVAVVGYSPFGSGKGTLPAASTPKGKILAGIASAHKATTHQVVLNFLSREKEVFLIPKAETLAHVDANAEALDFELSKEEIQRIEDAFPRPKRAESLPTI